MDPTITAAWISGGVGAVGVVGTAVTAWIGSRSTRKATEQAIAAGADNTRATLAAAREDRLWEKRAAAYETTVEALLYRQQKRYDELRTFRLDEDSEQKIADFFASYQAPGWFETQARLVAYASDATRDAYEVSQRADSEAVARYQDYRLYAEDNKDALSSGNPEDAHDILTMRESRRAMGQAVREAMTTDELLIKVIRDELRSRPEAAMPPPALPAVRPRFQGRLRG